MNTVVLGIGNPLLSDDGVGIQVVRALAGPLAARSDVFVREFYAGGIRLMEAITGHDRAVLIDSILTEGGEPGSVYRLELSDLRETRHAHSTHDASLTVALEFGRMAGLKVPEHVEIWAIEAADVATVREKLTPAVADAVPRVIQGVLRSLDSDGRPRQGDEA